MFKSLEVFQVSNAMARHAASRQSLVARNMANADTPGYVARDLPSFKEVVNTTSDASKMRATRDVHFGAGLSAKATRSATLTAHSSPNGNGVSIEEEMMKAVDLKRQHDRALAIYKSSLNVLRASLGRQ